MLSTAVSLFACGGTTEPRELGGILPLASFTERLASMPQFWQTGTFEYDGQDRLVRYEFSHNGSGEPRVTLYVTYQYEGALLSGSELFVRSTDDFERASVQRNTYDDRGRIRQMVADGFHEVTGEPVQSVCDHTYDELDRLVGLLCGSHERNVFSYDAAGNLLSEEAYFDDGDGLELRSRFSYAYDAFRNPFAAMPLHSGVIHVAARWPTLSSGNPVSWSVRGGQDDEVVSWHTADMEYNEAGHPMRRLASLVNASNPADATVVISEYQYVGLQLLR